MKLTLLSAMLMTAVVGITSANAADYKKLLLPPMQLIRGLAVGCHVTWINLRIVLKISTVWLISSASMTDEQIAKLPFALYRQGYEYYWKTHAHPNSTFKYTTSSLLDLMNSEITTY